jgi:hypothetical protein
LSAEERRASLDKRRVFLSPEFLTRSDVRSLMPGRFDLCKLPLIALPIENAAPQARLARMARE